MEIMFFRAVFPGFFGSEDAPTTATLFGLKNVPSADMSCTISSFEPGRATRTAALYEMPQLYRFRPFRDQRKITKTRSETAALDDECSLGAAFPAWPGTDTSPRGRERMVAFRVDARA
jgi:hypothetical protein